MSKCVKNRQYIDAQKAKDKIEQAYLCIKKRNINHINQKMINDLKKLEDKHQEEKQIFLQDWNQKINGLEMMFNQTFEKRRRQNQEQYSKLKEQVELALPLTHTPDEKLKNLRHQEKRLAEQGEFLQAQRIKEEIEDKQRQLQERHKKLREANIKSMLDQLTQKHERQLKQRQKQKKMKMDEILKQRNKKFKQLGERQAKQMKQMKWIYNQQMRQRN